jgi:hypothetical protein
MFYLSDYRHDLYFDEITLNYSNMPNLEVVKESQFFIYPN